MSLKHTIIPVLLVFILTAGLSLGQDAAGNASLDNATVPEDGTVAPDVASENTTAPADAATDAAADAVDAAAAAGNATENATESPAAEAAAAAPNLQYIWSVTAIEPEQVTMVLSQEGEDLFGQAKFEPESGEPWNAVVAGSVSGDQVDLVITALKGDKLVATRMSGTFAAEAINGKFFQVSDGQIAGRGDFSAMWINPDVSSYSPAVIAQPAAETVSQPAQTDNATTTPAVTAGAGAGETAQPVQLGQSSSRFVDVRKYKDQIGPGGDLSGIPPGMGGAGL